MSTFLQLVAAVKRESGLTGGAPSAFSSATGDDLRIFHWVSWSWREIDLMHETWLWRHGEATATTSGSRVLSGSADFGLPDFGRWMQPDDIYRPSCYRVSDGASSERPLLWRDYNDFRNLFELGSHIPGGLQYWSIKPDGSMVVGPTQDEPHIVRAQYIKRHMPLEEQTPPETATPGMPTDFHPLIVWKALMQYGGFDAGTEVWQRAERNYNSLISSLLQSQLPPMRWARRPLA